MRDHMVREAAVAQAPLVVTSMPEQLPVSVLAAPSQVPIPITSHVQDVASQAAEALRAPAQSAASALPGLLRQCSHHTCKGTVRAELAGSVRTASSGSQASSAQSSTPPEGVPTTTNSVPVGTWANHVRKSHDGCLVC